MKKLILFVFFLIKCNLDNTATFTYYDTGNENNKLLLESSFQKFNDLVGCKAISLKILNEKKDFELNNGITEIEFVNQEKIQSTMIELKKDIIYTNIAGFTALNDGDILVLENNAFEHCMYKELDECKYNRLDVVVFHELGHAFGLSHVDDNTDVMFASCLASVDQLNFKSFADDLHKKTRMCKVIYE